MSTKGVMRVVWSLSSSNASASRQPLNKFGLLSLLWLFFSYLFWPKKENLYVRRQIKQKRNEEPISEAWHQ